MLSPSPAIRLASLVAVVMPLAVGCLRGGFAPFDSGNEAADAAPDRRDDRAEPLDYRADGSASPTPDFQEGFAGAVIDPATWHISSGSPYCAYAIDGGQLSLRMEEPDLHYCLFITQVSYDLRGASVLVHVPQAFGAEVGAQTVVYLRHYGYAHYQIIVEGGRALVANKAYDDGTVEDFEINGDSVYDAQAHWWRLRPAEGRLLWEISGSASGPWRLQASTELVAPPDAIRLVIGIGIWKETVTTVSPSALFDCISLTGVCS